MSQVTIIGPIVPLTEAEFLLKAGPGSITYEEYVLVVQRCSNYLYLCTLENMKG